MNENHVSKIAKELSITGKQVAAVAGLLGEGCTIPFIARYRKEATDSLDEVAITAIRDRSEQLADLDDRRDAILKSLEERELLTDELKQSILAAETLSTLEDIYLPYRPKRRTRATIAKDKGLEPLAQQLFEQGKINPLVAAEPFINPEKGVDSAEDALAGARDIIAEWVNENAEIRSAIRQLFFDKGEIRSKVVAGKEEEGAKFRDYFDAAEKAAASPSHRILAVFRGEKEGALSVSLRPSDEEAVGIIERRLVKARNDAGRQVYMAIEDGYKRLLAPSMETEIRQEIKKRADEEAIKVFAANLRELLYAPPLGQKNVLALDPGFRTGSKLVCLDAQGKLLHYDTVFLTQSAKAAEEGGAKIKKLCAEFGIEAIAIGNGTASRETETFVRSLELPKSIQLVIVNESGASIYSASKVAREEFPDHDVTVRGSVSIGRRLMDPLAELVKIDPKSIGVGQYQHDVDQTALKRSLDDVVSSCVNQVGVELNTASKELLTYVSGLGPVLAKNIVQWRDANGAFRSRKEIQKVPRLGPKAFQQCAGFLRIRNSKNPLDTSAVHPESYHIVEKMAKDLGSTVSDLMADEALRKKLRLRDYVEENVGLPTLNDIMDELAKPGRDPRDQFEAFAFSEQASSIDDLKAGMSLPGIVTNITKFGAFVDIGVHQDGLVHISQMADKFIRDPSEVVKVQQKVMVTVLEVDKARKRISLSMKSGKS
jgi:uncharacterized protein